MGIGGDTIGLQDLPADLGDTATALIANAASVGGAILLLDPNDRVALANERQRQLMPVPEYVGLTYTELFWLLQRAGLLGNPAARANPSAWLEVSQIVRTTQTFTQTIYAYPTGRVAMSNRRLDNGWSIQLRHPVGELADVDPEAVLLTAVRATRDVAALRRALNRTEVGTAILTGSGARLYANDAFDDLVRKANGLVSAAGGRVAAAHPDDEQHWQDALRAAVAGGRGLALLRRRGGTTALAVNLLPGEHENTVIVLAAVPRQRLSSPAADWLRELGLRASEVEVLGAMMQGMPTSAIASQLDVTPGTINAAISRARTALRDRGLSVDGPGLLALALQMSTITRAPSEGRTGGQDG
jgi:DNA-binding CsgD family transcriptional regulator